jgi:hypothetical protein
MINKEKSAVLLAILRPGAEFVRFCYTAGSIMIDLWKWQRTRVRNEVIVQEELVARANQMDGPVCFFYECGQIDWTIAVAYIQLVCMNKFGLHVVKVVVAQEFVETG